MLTPGGTFVSKIFRSKEYTHLLYGFNQLFEHVDATKPTASRNASAEIFVVCRGYKAPRKIDPQLLDHRTLFQVRSSLLSSSLFVLAALLYGRAVSNSVQRRSLFVACCF